MLDGLSSPKDRAKLLNRCVGLLRAAKCFKLCGVGIKSDIHRILENLNSHTDDSTAKNHLAAFTELDKIEIANEKWSKDEIALQFLMLTIVFYDNLDLIREWYAAEEQKEKIFRFLSYVHELLILEKDRKLAIQHLQQYAQLQSSGMSSIEKSASDSMKYYGQVFFDISRQIKEIHEEKKQVYEEFAREVTESLTNYEAVANRLFSDSHQANLFFANYISRSHLIEFYHQDSDYLDQQIHCVTKEIEIVKQRRQILAARLTTKAQANRSGRMAITQMHTLSQNVDIKKMDRKIEQLQMKESSLMFFKQDKTTDALKHDLIEQLAKIYDIEGLQGKLNSKRRQGLLNLMQPHEARANLRLNPLSVSEHKLEAEKLELKLQCIKVHDEAVDRISEISQLNKRKEASVQLKSVDTGSVQDTKAMTIVDSMQVSEARLRAAQAELTNVEVASKDASASLKDTSEAGRLMDFGGSQSILICQNLDSLLDSLLANDDQIPEFQPSRILKNT